MAGSKMPQSDRMTTPEGRACYAFVFRASKSKGDEDKDPTYRLQILIPKTNVDGIKALKDAAKAIMLQAFGANYVELVKAGRLHWPFRDGDIEKPDEAPYKGMVFMNAKNTNKPQIVDENVQEIIDPEGFCSGDWCKLSGRFFAFDNKQKGVAFSLGNIQRTRRDTRLDNRVDAKTEFEKLEGASGAGSAAGDFDDL